MNVAEVIEKLKAFPPDAQFRARIPYEIVHRECYDVEFEVLMWSWMKRPGTCSAWADTKYTGDNDEDRAIVRYSLGHRCRRPQ